MQSSSKSVLANWIKDKPFQAVLDAPSGDGWLKAILPCDSVVDGVDLYETSKEGYRFFWQHDLDRGLPASAGEYDLIAICEGLEHVGNPLLLLRDAFSHLKHGGCLVVTTPSVWYPQSRLQFLYKGFFPSFPALGGKVVPGTHMHITPWCYPWLWTYLSLAGFSHIELLPEPELTGKHMHERLMVWPSRLWCRRRMAKARSSEERDFWQTCASDAALLGRHLIVVAHKKSFDAPH